MAPVSRFRLFAGFAGFAMTLIFSGAASAQAGARTLICDSTQVGGLPATVEFDAAGLVARIWEVDSDEAVLLFEADQAVQINAAYSDVSGDYLDLYLTHQLADVALSRGQPFHTVSASVSSLFDLSKPWSRLSATFRSQVQSIGEDGSGVIFMEFKDENSQPVASALFAGWAGTYRNCHP